MRLPTYSIGDLFTRHSGELAMLVQVEPHTFKLICLQTGNRISDHALVGKSHHKLAPSTFRRHFGRAWKPVARMSDLEVAIWVSQYGRK